MEYKEPDIDEEVRTQELRNTMKIFTYKLEESLLTMPLWRIEYVDVVFHRGQSGIAPRVSIRRVMDKSNVETHALYDNIIEVVRYDADDLKELRDELENNE